MTADEPRNVPTQTPPARDLGREQRWAEALVRVVTETHSRLDELLPEGRERALHDARILIALADEERRTEVADKDAEIERLRGEVAHWEHHAWEAGEGFKRAIEGSVRAHDYRRAVERDRDAAQAEAARLRDVVAKVEALRDEWAEHIEDCAGCGYDEPLSELDAALSDAPQDAALTPPAAEGAALTGHTLRSRLSALGEEWKQASGLPTPLTYVDIEAATPQQRTLWECAADLLELASTPATNVERNQEAKEWREMAARVARENPFPLVAPPASPTDDPETGEGGGDRG